MARISLKCVCGWNFFIPGTVQGHATPCPNCGDAVSIPGRKDTGEGPKSPGAIAAEKQARQKQVVFLVSIAAGILLVAVVILVATSGGPPPVVVEDNKPRLADRPQGRPPTSRNPSLAPGAADVPLTRDPGLPTGPNRELKIEELKAGIRGVVWKLNLAGIASESLRLRGHADAHSQLQERMRGWEARITESLASLLELGDRFGVEPHIQPGDRLIGFAQKDFATMTSSKNDLDILSPWLRSFRAGQPLEQAVILRGTQRIELYFQFPEAPEDLQGLARLPDITGPGRYEDGPVVSPGTGPLPAGLVKEVETRFQAIPSGYRQLFSPADAQKLDQILKTKAGTPDDHVFLQARVLTEALPAFEREAALIKAKASELELKIKETTSVDVVHFKDGRKVSGQVLADTPEHVKLKSRLGSMTIPRADVARIELGKGAGVEFPGKLAAAPRTSSDLARLLAWCQENNLKLEGEYTATLLLTIDPLHDGARKATGLTVRPGGKTPGGLGTPLPSGPLGAPGASSDQVVRTLDLLAADVVKKHPAFGDVVAQMRAGSIGLAYGSAPLPPPRSARAAALIQEPLGFELSRLDASGALEIGQWWGSMNPEDRREFARFFGLWCAQQRQIRGGR